MKFSIEPIIDAFPRYQVAVVVADGLTVEAERGPKLESLITEAENQAATCFDPEALGTLPAIADWRQAYRDFGIKQTKYRASVERLLRSAVKQRGLPRISQPVDAYNLISLKYLAPVGADDLDSVSGDLCFRFATGAESFLPLGKAEQGEDPPKPGEVVYADASKVLCRRWNWYQDARSCISKNTQRAVVTIQSLGHVDIAAAADDLKALWQSTCAREVRWTLVDCDHPVTDI